VSAILPPLAFGGGHEVEQVVGRIDHVLARRQAPLGQTEGS
jgi:hypothetical protein